MPLSRLLVATIGLASLGLVGCGAEPPPATPPTPVNNPAAMALAWKQTAAEYDALPDLLP